MKINYEFHLTVKNVNKDDFVQFCRDIDVKPILLELQNKENVTILNDTMTSHYKLLNNDSEALKELYRVKDLLVKQGFNVVRDKIEADINHPDLTDTFFIDNKDKYFETHFNVLSDDIRSKKLQEIALRNNCHFSRNVFKKVGNQYTIMITYRKYTGNVIQFKEDVSKIEKDLFNNYFKVEKIVVEYAMFDSKEDWDKNWLNSTQE